MGNGPRNHPAKRTYYRTLSPQVFHKHRKTVMNLHGNEQNDEVSRKDGGLAADANHDEKP